MHRNIRGITKQLFRIVPLLLIAGSLNAATSDAAAPVRVHGGTVLVRSLPNATFFVVWNGDGSGGAQHLFQVWSKPGLDLSATYHGADVEYTGTALVVVVPSEKTAMTFNVVTHKPPTAPAPEGFSTTAFEISGMNHVVGPVIEGILLPTAHASGKIRANECDWCQDFGILDPGATGAGGCAAGGNFSTSCSISGPGGSCSVTCGLGYACCNTGNPPSCTCKF